MSFQQDVLRALSVGGAVNICVTGEGLFMVNIKTKDRSAWYCHHGETPALALAEAVARFADEDANILELAAERRASQSPVVDQDLEDLLG